MSQATLIERAAATLAGRRAAARLVEHFSARLIGAEHIPARGPALLVGNHTLLGLDSFVLTALLALEVGRTPRFLGEKNLWRVPVLRGLLDRVGAVAGEPGVAVGLLRQGELVVVYPGGVDDSFKLSSEAYRLQWGERAGFARVAAAAGVPVVPVAAVGVDELFEVRRREHFLGRRLLASPRYDLPRPENWLPRRVPLTYHVLPAIDGRGDPDDPGFIEKIRVATRCALESVLEPEHARVVRFPPGGASGGARGGV